MYDPQHLVDLHDAGGDRFAGDGLDPRSWLSGDDHSSAAAATSILHRADSSLSAASVVDQRLVNDILEMVPLVQSLIDRKPNTSFTRRASVIYTKTPSRESLYKKNAEAKGRNANQTIPTKKQRDQNKNAGSNLDGDNLAGFSSRSSLSEKEREELIALREQVEDLQRKLLEKDEVLKEVENSKNELASLHSKLDEMQLEFTENDSLLRSTQMQLSDAKIKLADKQAAVEKLEWEATTSAKKVEKLQEDVEAMQGEIALFMKFVGELTNCDVIHPNPDEDYDVPYPWDEMGESNAREMQKLEAAREAYVTALAAAKERPDESSIAAAATARKHLQSLVVSF